MNVVSEDENKQRIRLRLMLLLYFQFKTWHILMTLGVLIGVGTHTLTFLKVGPSNNETMKKEDEKRRGELIFLE